MSASWTRYVFGWCGRVVGAAALLLAAGPRCGSAQDLDFQRGRAHAMLHMVRDDIRKSYYDSTYHGVDLAARAAVADARLDSATSVGQMFGAIEQLVLELNDSHTAFIPPERVTRVDYGFLATPIAGGVYVTAVRPKSGADSAGLRPGDRILRYQSFQPTRTSLRTIDFIYEVLYPMRTLELGVQHPGGAPQTLAVPAMLHRDRQFIDLTNSAQVQPLILNYENELRRIRNRSAVVDSVFVWKMFEFDDVSGMDDMMKKARRYPALVLDLRGNPGGYVSALERLAGHFVDSATVLSIKRFRNKVDTTWARPRGGQAVRGRLSYWSTGVPPRLRRRLRASSS